MGMRKTDVNFVLFRILIAVRMFVNEISVFLLFNTNYVKQLLIIKTQFFQPAN